MTAIRFRHVAVFAAALALGLGIVLLAITTLINGAAVLIKHTAERRYAQPALLGA